MPAGPDKKACENTLRGQSAAPSTSDRLWQTEKRENCAIPRGGCANKTSITCSLLRTHVTPALTCPAIAASGLVTLLPTVHECLRPLRETTATHQQIPYHHLPVKQHQVLGPPHSSMMSDCGNYFLFQRGAFQFPRHTRLLAFRSPDYRLWGLTLYVEISS